MKDFSDFLTSSVMTRPVVIGLVLLGNGIGAIVRGDYPLGLHKAGQLGWYLIAVSLALMVPLPGWEGVIKKLRKDRSTGVGTNHLRAGKS